MLARCALVITRSVLNRPCSRIWLSSSAICGATLANIGGLRMGWLAGGLCPVEYYLAAPPAAHGLEGGGIVGSVEPVRDHRADVDAGLGQHRHPVPGLEHLAAVDALDRDHVEHQVSPVDGELGGWQSEHRDLAAVRHRA